MSIADGSLLPPQSTHVKTWRLRVFGLGPGLAGLRLVRADNDCDEAIGSRCLGDAAFTVVRDEGAEEGCVVDAAVELTTPSRPGAYRIFFRLLADAPTVEGVDELYCDVFVGAAAESVPWRDYQLRQRGRLESALARSWDGAALPAAGGTLVIAFAGADARVPGPVEGGVPSHEFVRALRAVSAHAAIFVRDVLRAWYLRGVGDTGHDFESVVDLLRREVAVVAPRRVVTLGCSMGGYAAIRAALALRASACVAFAPQVVLEPRMRRALGLPRMGFDDHLEALAAVARAECFECASLVDSVRAAAMAAGGTTHLEVHVGSLCPGDVLEARLLATACSERAALAGAGVEVVVHEGRDHCLAAGLRDSGELQDVLARLVGSSADPLAADRPVSTALPDGFVGFEGCEDF